MSEALDIQDTMCTVYMQVLHARLCCMHVLCTFTGIAACFSGRHIKHEVQHVLKAQSEPTHQTEWNGAEHANSIVHVQTLIIENHINVSLGQIIHSIPEMEVKAPAGYLAGKGGEFPSGSIVTMHLQLSIQSSCVASTVCVTDCHKTRRCGIACYS